MTRDNQPTTGPGPAGLDDEKLVRRARSGDLDAFGELVRRHQSVAFRVAARVVGPHDAEDVSQDAFLRAFHRLGQYRGDASFRAWLLRIVHNAAMDALDRRREDADDEIELRIENRDAARAPRTLADALEDDERRERLATKIRLLRGPHRSVLVLRDLEGLSYEEIAEITNMPVGSVKGRLHRARNELIEILRNNTYDWELPA